MRPRFQQGQITKRGSNWVLRYHEDRQVDGQTKRVRTTKILGPYSEHPLKPSQTTQLRSLFNEKINVILAGVNAQAGTVAGSNLTVGEFIEGSYFPRLEQRTQLTGEIHIEPTTVDGYRDIWKVHVKDNPAAKIQLKNFKTFEGQQFLESLPQHLSHRTHMRVKNFMSGVFTWALASKALDGANPMDNTKAGGLNRKRDLSELTLREQKIRASQEHAYSLEEVADMLAKLPEPARTVCATAAFTGLTRSELRGLKWSDYDGEVIKVQRKIVNSYIGETKTEAREAEVYVVPDLRAILKKYRTNFPSGKEDWVFRGERLMRPLDLDNLSRRDIPQYINGAWFGWHAFRRGLGTRLYEANVDEKDIQAILRHADAETTRKFYIQPNRQRAEAGLRKFASVLRKQYGISRRGL